MDLSLGGAVPLTGGAPSKLFIVHLPTLGSRRKRLYLSGCLPIHNPSHVSSSADPHGLEAAVAFPSVGPAQVQLENNKDAITVGSLKIRQSHWHAQHKDSHFYVPLLIVVAGSSVNSGNLWLHLSLGPTSAGLLHLGGESAAVFECGGGHPQGRAPSGVSTSFYHRADSLWPIAGWQFRQSGLGGGRTLGPSATMIC